jgi:hypothetical protein
MAAIAKSTVAVRFFGDELEPSELSALLGCEPSMQYRRGDPVSPGRPNIRKCGAWLLSAEDRQQEALDEQLEGIFAKLTQDLEVWKSLSSRFDADVFCGLFMNESNEGFSLSRNTLAALSARNLEIGFDVYDPNDEPTEQAPRGEA